MEGHNMIPAFPVYTSSQLTPEWLTKQLQNIYGSSLVGLWVADDAVFNGTNVTSWPGRIGGTATRPSASIYYQASSQNGHRVIFNSSVAGVATLQANVGTVADYFVAASPFVLPFGDYRELITQHSTYNNSLVGDIGKSSIVDRGVPEYVNGIRQLNVTTALAILELNGTISSPIDIGGWTSGVYNWLGTIGTVVMLSATATPSQRIQTNFILKKYYNIPISTQEQLAYDLSLIYNTSLIGLWIGEDIVTDVTGSVTSWPGRTGGTLTRHASSTGNVTLATIDGRTYIAPNTGSAIRFDGTASGNIFDICVMARTDNSLAGFRTLCPANGGSGWIMGSTADEYRGLSGMSFWQDNVASNITRSSGKHILEAQKLGNTTISILNFDFTGNAAYQCSADFAFLRLLSSGPSTQQRTSEIALLKSYYGI